MSASDLSMKQQLFSKSIFFKLNPLLLPLFFYFPVKKNFFLNATDKQLEELSDVNKNRTPADRGFVFVVDSFA